MPAGLYNTDVTAITANLGGATAPDGITLAQPAVALTSAGTTQATAAVIPASVVRLTVATAAQGVMLPAGQPTLFGWILPAVGGAANAYVIYPPVGGTINNGAVNAGFSAAANTPYQYICLDQTNYSIK